ncbi:hypothetical protein ACX93W_21520 [Paenibacillus sp. CAU 1782]
MSRRFTTNEMITLIIACIALLFSVFSWIYNTYYTVQKDKKDEMELIDIRLIGISNEEKVLYQKMNLGNLGEAIIPLNYEVLVSNNSKRTISIIDHDLKELVGDSSFYYSKLINKVTVNSKEIEYPIKIEEGESKKFEFSINLLIKPEVNKMLTQKYQYNSLIPFEELMMFLHVNGLDIYGNKVKTTIVGESVLVELIGEYSTPIYNVAFTTARINHFSKLLKQNDLFKEM